MSSADAVPFKDNLVYSTFKCTMDPPHIEESNQLLNTIIWPEEITSMIGLVPKPQYDDEAIQQRPDSSYYRSTAKSFRLRTNTFSRIGIDQSPKDQEQKSQIAKPTRRKSYR